MENKKKDNIPKILLSCFEENEKFKTKRLRDLKNSLCILGMLNDLYSLKKTFERQDNIFVEILFHNKKQNIKDFISKEYEGILNWLLENEKYSKGFGKICLYYPKWLWGLDVMFFDVFFSEEIWRYEEIGMCMYDDLFKAGLYGGYDDNHIDFMHGWWKESVEGLIYG